MSEVASKVASEMADYGKQIAKNEAKRAVDAKEKEKERLRTFYGVQHEVLEERAQDAFWKRAPQWTDAEYYAVLAEMPARPGGK